MTSSNAFKPLTKDDVAEVLGVSLRTIDNWVGENILPAPKKLGNRVYWHPNTFYAWLDLRLNETDEAPELTSHSDTVPTKVPEKAAPKAHVKAPKNELEALRFRSQKKLDALTG